MILQKEYVLTPGFAVKLFAIHARISAGQNVILSGDTVSCEYIYIFHVPPVLLTCFDAGDRQN